ncbi:MAG: DsbA family protein [Chromatiaceae bacterium]|nr:DsbA family protein [Chromatiaceae bacterium]
MSLGRALPLFALALVAAAEGPPVLRFDGGSVSLAAVDAASRGKAPALLEALHEEAALALDALIDERLVELAGGTLAVAPVPPVSEDEIDRFRRERAADFEGPEAPQGSAAIPAVRRAAIRHYLEEQAREGARRGALGALRARHRVEPKLPDSAELAAPLAPGRVVARLDGEPLCAGDLEARAALRLYRLRGELARERLRVAEDLLAERLLAAEAARRGMDVEALVASQTAAPGADAFAELAAAERALGRPEPDPERARPLLEFRARQAARQALLARLRAEADVEVAIELPRPPRLPVLVDDAPFLGRADGARLIVYANYRCHACRRAHAEIDRLLSVSDEVRVVFRDWIPAYDPAARQAAALARCAARQGHFAEMRAALLAVERPDFGLPWPEGDAGPVARVAGLDAVALRTCLTGAMDPAIERDSAQARAMGFEHAPAFVAEGVPLSGTQSAEGLARALRESLRAR